MHSGIYNWRFQTEPEPELDGRSIYWPRGKALGGSSTINGMIYVRGNAADYDRWAQMGNPGWSYAEVLPYFRKSEPAHAATPTAATGRSRSPRPGTNPLFERFRGRRRSRPCLNDDFNGASQDGFGRYDFTIPERQAAQHVAGLPPPVLRQTEPHRRHRGDDDPHRRRHGRAVAVDYARGDAHHRAHAAREIVLSAGALGSPQILMLSGIGDADELKAHGIAAVHHLPGVGRNLQDHVDCCLVYEITQPTSLYSDLRVDRLTLAILRGALFGEGVATTFPYEGGAFLRSRPGLVAPDIQAHFMPALEKTANLHWPKLRSKARVGDNHGVTIRVGPVNPESRGRITLRSADPRDPPRIFANYLGTQFDKDTTIAGVRLLRDVMRQPTLRRHHRAPRSRRAGESSPTPTSRSGSARPGTTLPPRRHLQDGAGRDAVVDHELRVTAPGRVADASIMPVIASGNTTCPPS
jgi:choline dehydrogenase